ncbi:unnamed protein product [Rotaria sp. Silwood2]|nr:unnamed protein product [Rotaria sp. Silwood2]CAF2951901.1 unnamed protein product [Rotaria sp. Silwood2]CAF3948434.1 unnamed protein product [Rotaria sp. Silwood2]
MQLGGQSILDRLLAAKNTISGQLVAKVVCKATTEEILGPKRKHLQFLLQATHEMNVSIPETADLLIERSQNSSWVVSFKSLITIHHLMSYGNERFEAYMASNNYHLQPSAMMDRIGMLGTDMLIYVRRYADYLNEKREAYKLMGYDFCKIKRGKDDGILRTMQIDKLYKALPLLQKQIDAILHFDVTPNQLTNNVIHSCFFLLIKDLIYLYAAFNEGIINLLEKYFNLNKKDCREALDMYKKFLDRTDQVSQYLKITEPSSMERSEFADLAQAPNSLLESLENHLAYLEGKKPSPQSLVSKKLIEQDIKNFSDDFVTHVNNDSQKILQEEAKAIAKFNMEKEASSPPLVSTQTTITTNENIFDSTDFFSQPQLSNGQQQQKQQQLLFTDDIFTIATPSSQTSTITFPTFQNIFDTSTSTSKPNVLGDVLQPTSVSTNKNTSSIPLLTNTQKIPTITKPLQSGDLNSSLNQLIDHLNVKDYTKIGKDHQWTPNDGKNQQIIGLPAGTTNTPGTTWSNPSIMSTPFSSMTVQSGPMWQQPPSTSSMNNPFVVSSESSKMGFNSMSDQPTNVNTNPFAAQTLYGTTVVNQQQIDNPFGDL